MASTAPNSASVEISDVSATVSILEQAAETTLEVGLRNPTSSRLEAEVLLPVPDGAVIRGFTFALLIGIVIGTYSSICIATPIVVDFAKKKSA